MWVKESGAWKFVSDVSSSAGIPEDLKAVAITLRDGRQVEVPVPLPAGEFAFSVKNAGTATKGLFLLGVRETSTYRACSRTWDLRGDCLTTSSKWGE